MNLVKSKLCGNEVEFLGFLVTHTGYQPTHKRVVAILKIVKTHNDKKGRGFLDTINFIKNSIPNNAETMAPITKLMITELTKEDVPVIWGQMELFDKTNATVANSTLCKYPNPNKRLVI